MFSSTLRDQELVISQGLRVAAESDISLKTMLSTFALNVELAFAILSNVIEQHGFSIFCGAFSRLALDTSSPASTMAASRYLDESCCQINTVGLIVNRLYTAYTGIVLVPSIAMDIFSLLTSVSEA